MDCRETTATALKQNLGVIIGGSTSIRSEEETGNAVSVIIIRRSPGYTTFVELMALQFGRCRDVPHDHAGGVH